MNLPSEDVRLAAEPADVLIIGAGASGAVVAKRLAEAGFKVVCLEQGDWHDQGGLPRQPARLGAPPAQEWATSPNIRGLPQDYPVDRGRHRRSSRSCTTASAARR